MSKTPLGFPCTTFPPLTSAVRYSRIAALYTAAVAPTLPWLVVRVFKCLWMRPTGNWKRPSKWEALKSYHTTECNQRLNNMSKAWTKNQHHSPIVTLSFYFLRTGTFSPPKSPNPTCLCLWLTPLPTVLRTFLTLLLLHHSTAPIASFSLAPFLLHTSLKMSPRVYSNCLQLQSRHLLSKGKI